MGLIVGEGCFTSSERKYPRLKVELEASDIDPLMALRFFFGGTLYGPYRNSQRRSKKRAWILAGDQLQNLLPLLWANMPPSKKRNQMEAWLIDFGLDWVDLDECRIPRISGADPLWGPARQAVDSGNQNG